jgi:hypothetical protein
VLLPLLDQPSNLLVPLLVKVPFKSNAQSLVLLGSNSGTTKLLPELFFHYLILFLLIKLLMPLILLDKL